MDLESYHHICRKGKNKRKGYIGRKKSIRKMRFSKEIP